MTRTMMFRSVGLLFLMFCGTLTAGAYNDYEVCAGQCEKRLEIATPQHSLDATICYETAQVDAITSTLAHVEPILEKADPREEKIRIFFRNHHSPGSKYAKLFVQVADANNIDWKLLPIFSFIESGGGRVHRNNNIFGWRSGKTQFKSIEAGIRFVGKALTEGPYKNKTANQKIRVYNRHRRYHVYADKLMKLLNGVDRFQKSSIVNR